MSNQGLMGALLQYWTIDEKPRLNRRNTYFEDLELSNINALRVGVVASTVVITIVVFWSLLGVIL